MIMTEGAYQILRELHCVSIVDASGFGTYLNNFSFYHLLVLGLVCRKSWESDRFPWLRGVYWDRMLIEWLGWSTVGEFTFWSDSFDEFFQHFLFFGLKFKLG